MPHLVARSFLVLFAALLPWCARANDTSATLETGGLRFKHDPDIVMRSEDLFISEREIRIVYKFINASAADKTIMIAFPMPDIVGTEDDENIGIPTDNSENIFDFRVSVDGRPVAPRLEQTALAKGVDQTPLLRTLGIPLMPIRGPAGERLDKLPKSNWPELVKLGVGAIQTYGSGGPMEDHLVPTWTLRSAYTWMQSFPAGRETTFEQTYRPSVGGSVQTIIGADNWRSNPEAKGFLASYCIDDDMIRTIERARAAKRLDYPPFSERSIAYVLSTGANWAAPIGDFHLTIDKGEPSNLVSFCADGVKKTGPTRFEVRHSNFTPSRDLKIVIFVPIKS
ncbi:DUF4424 domain-containing protein [Bradyrhizobium genosp. L]|uniref:DUF4424 domain-containing protein n=1 Tax=Bradyrhizobium genosp. L TaxID=83637 RepID=UPI0018A320BE|nr:DUF4424 domain-containing protein [Bradyrhizobium genosp. L]QPF83619.1 DUF4424 domain-containing protein [Bradyrhizobium genosp. L]